ncbi:MAG: hypothetical protein QNJ63_31585 [Calothrix sp. MO_192.B10]|nr:hypothetical protein [Calothrix sp. MO_192.B10]
MMADRFTKTLPRYNQATDVTHETRTKSNFLNLYNPQPLFLLAN